MLKCFSRDCTIERKWEMIWMLKRIIIIIIKYREYRYNETITSAEAGTEPFVSDLVIRL